MTFQFMCPQGHLLAGDYSQMGMPCQCPHCGMTFIIPRVDVQPQQHYAPANPYGHQPQQGYGGYMSEPAPQQAFGGYMSEPAPQEAYGGYHPEPEHHHEMAPAAEAESHAEEEHSSPVAAIVEAPVQQTDPNILHIPCPNGHILETPPDMIGQEVLCPHCAAQFMLKNEESVEYKQRQEQILARRSEFWFKWSIAAAVVVVLGLLGMFAVIASR